MASRQEEKERRRLAIEAVHAAEAERNRVLVDLPDRLHKAKIELKRLEELEQNLMIVYAQRVILKDSVVLDNIGDLLGAPPLPGDER